MRGRRGRRDHDDVLACTTAKLCSFLATPFDFQRLRCTFPGLKERLEGQFRALTCGWVAGLLDDLALKM